MVYDGAGNEGSNAVEVTINNESEVSDTIPPTVTITKPADQSTVRKKVDIRVSGQDNQAVTRLTLFIDGLWKADSESDTLNYRWNTRKAAKGWHTIRATAEDAAGNSTSTSILVNVTRRSVGGGKGKNGQ